jgi:integrase/recombinase XerC
MEHDLSSLTAQWEDWLFLQRRLSSHTLLAYRHDLGQFLSFITLYLSEEISPSLLASLKIQDFRAWLADRHAKNYTPRSTARALSVIRNFFKYLEKFGYHNTAILAIRSPRLKPGLPKPLPVSDAKTLAESIANLEEEPWVGARNRALFSLMYSCGIRLGEALSLTYEDIDKANDVLTIVGKGNKQRQVPLIPLIKEAILTYITLCPYPFSQKTPLFLGVQGKKLNACMAQRAMRHYRAFAGLPETTTPHVLRHSCATHLMSASGDLRSVQELLGHASLATTQIYTNLDEEYLMNIYTQAHPRSRHDSKK